MKKALCTLLYKLHLRRLAYKVSPSVYGSLMGREIQAALAAGLACIGGVAKSLTETTAPKPGKHNGLRAEVVLVDELHEKVEQEG